MEITEIKQRIKDYFVEINEDKFTDVKTAKSKQELIWNGLALENKFMITKNNYSHKLTIGLNYAYKNNSDLVTLRFSYSNEDNYPNLNNLNLFLLLDETKKIQFTNPIALDNNSLSDKRGDNYFTLYFEYASLIVEMSDLIAIANANKIEYSIRFGRGHMDGVFSEEELLIFKGFYNAVFDEDFEVNSIFDKIKNRTVISTKKNINKTGDYTKIEPYVKKYTISEEDLIEMSRLCSQVNPFNPFKFFSHMRAIRGIEALMTKKYNIGIIDQSVFRTKLKKNPVH
jgi:hypothetical protein